MCGCASHFPQQAALGGTGPVGRFPGPRASRADHSLFRLKARRYSGLQWRTGRQFVTRTIRVSSGSVPLVAHRPLVPLAGCGDPAGPFESFLVSESLPAAPIGHLVTPPILAGLRPATERSAQDDACRDAHRVSSDTEFRP